MVGKRDYYEVLGVSKDTSKDEIKRAYRKLAKKYHPDVAENKTEAAERFKEVSEAYEVLADDDKRALYDKYGHAGLQGSFGAQGFDWSDFSHYQDISDIFGDIFNGSSVFDQFFGTSGRGPRSNRGPDLRYNMQISLDDAYKGMHVEVRVPKEATCEKCKGSGARPGTAPIRCQSCGGTGQVRHGQSQGFIQFVRIGPCPSCRGKGDIVKEPCPECHGRGKVPTTSKIKIEVPPGVETGSRLRITGQGEAGEKGGPSGDLYVVIFVKQDDRVEREGEHLYMTETISFGQAALGDDVEITTLDGTVAKLKIPPGTQPGTIFSLRGKGMPTIGGRGYGNLFVKAEVEVPRKLTTEQKNLIKEFDKKVAKRRKGLFEL